MDLVHGLIEWGMVVIFNSRNHRFVESYTLLHSNIANERVHRCGTSGNFLISNTELTKSIILKKSHIDGESIWLKLASICKLTY